MQNECFHKLIVFDKNKGPILAHSMQIYFSILALFYHVRVCAVWLTLNELSIISNSLRGTTSP